MLLEIKNKIILTAVIFLFQGSLFAADCNLPDRSRADWFLPDPSGIVWDDYSVSASVISAEVFPNPGQDLFKIKVYLKMDLFLRIEIDDLNGKKVKDISNTLLIAPSEDFEWKLDDNSGKKVSVGIYFLNIKSAKGNLSKKLIIE